LKKPRITTPDPRRARLVEFLNCLSPEAFESYLLRTPHQQFKDARDLVECFCFAQARGIRIDFARVTYSPEYLYVTDSRHNAPIFYGVTPPYLRKLSERLNEAAAGPYEAEGLVDYFRHVMNLRPRRAVA
jgi:hypothetical protein